MVSENFGLPEPPHPEEPVTTNNDVVMPNESESDDETNEYNGYEPLSTHPDNDLDEDDEEIEQDEGAAGGDFESIIRAEDVLVGEVWSCKENVVDIVMDKEKEDLVKEVMLNFTLPASSIPDWAVNVPEEQWKEHLMKRLETLKKE
ncbi:male-enhanced antigen 1 [Onthophagus taurus]|uniref:male-enhanced antigen 1 n=1 Tax=Onthophagus taurus TaxID=166361 RepID=UPI000C20A5F5|nr:uncharacterized protein LOC111424243 [Onthophagus taurus]